VPPGLKLVWRARHCSPDRPCIAFRTIDHALSEANDHAALGCQFFLTRRFLDWFESKGPRLLRREIESSPGFITRCQAGPPPFADANQMDHPESISIIMMLALSVLLGVIILICWCRDLWQQRAAIRWATQPLVDSADKGDGPESVQHGLRDADMDLAALRLSSGGWRTFPSTDELKTYVDVLAGDALRQSNARLLALVLAILVGVIGTLVILAVWLSPRPEQIQAARNGQGKQGTQQSTPAGGDAQPSLLGQYGEYEQSASTPAPEQSAAARAPEQSTSTPVPEQPGGWIAEVKKSRPICESADDYVQFQRMVLRSSGKAMRRRAVEFVKRKCPIIRFEPGNQASVERTETFSIDKTRSITLACVVIKDGPCAWTDASALVRIPEEAPFSRRARRARQFR